ncbi:phosphoribosyl-ATP diphosphatase [Tunicatimonas pelagia]|uniref:phosphoribosyl-ATP diphosphatase n=1 Tax=Tunicatimonas pelagia TaxID=931531 RepID=UPI003F541D98
MISNLEFLQQLTGIIKQRHQMAQGDEEKLDSYVARLFRKGMNKVAQKVGEEAVELVIEAKDNDDELFKNEAADLLFHLMILLEAKGMSLEEIIEVLERRHQ